MNYKEYKRNIEIRNKNLIAKLNEVGVPKLVKFDDYELIINPGVFDPSLGEGSQIMAKIKSLFSGEAVLEIGTGTGALAILAAEKSKKVIATDISEDALKCANENIVKYNLESKIEFRLGNLFSPIKEDEKFDIILFNPPFLNGNPKSNLDNSYFDNDYCTLKLFFTNVFGYLMPNGKIYLCFGGVGDVGYLNYLITYYGFGYEIVKSQNYNNLNFFIYRIIKP